jgi:tetratricopeptide (TPR) repeat protein
VTGIADTVTAPFRGNALAVNLTFGLLFGTLLFFMERAFVFAFYALPAFVILLPWFLKYCLVVGQQAAYGRRAMPRLSMENLNPLEVQPLGLAAGLIGLYYALAFALGPAAATIGLALVTPAAIGALIVEERAIDALDPRVLAHYVAGLGPAYPLLALVLGAGLWACIVTLGAGLGVFATVFLLQSVLIATFHGIGRILLAREGRIAYARPETPDERAERYGDQEQRRAFDAALGEAYTLAEADKPERALEIVRDYVQGQGNDPDLYAAALDRLREWPDPTVGLAFAREYVARLQQLGDETRALEVFLEAHDREPALRPIGEDATLRLARAARKADRPDAALALVEDFEDRFPDSRYHPVALVEQARLLLTAREDPAAALRVLARLEQDHPSVMARDDVQRLHQRVRQAAAS